MKQSSPKGWPENTSALDKRLNLNQASKSHRCSQAALLRDMPLLFCKFNVCWDLMQTASSLYNEAERQCVATMWSSKQIMLTWSLSLSLSHMWSLDRIMLTIISYSFLGSSLKSTRFINISNTSSLPTVFKK